MTTILFLRCQQSNYLNANPYPWFRNCLYLCLEEKNNYLKHLNDKKKTKFKTNTAAKILTKIKTHQYYFIRSITLQEWNDFFCNCFIPLKSVLPFSCKLIFYFALNKIRKRIKSFLLSAAD